MFRGVPPIWGLFLAFAGLLLATCWPLAGFLLALSFPTRISLENRFLGRLAKTVNSLHENGCFSKVSVFRGVPPSWGLSWPLAGLFLASCWFLAGVLLAAAGFLLASCWPLAGLLLASSWSLAGFLLASSFPTRISLENRFLGRLAKTVNSLHEYGCFSMVSVFRGVPPIWGLSWPLAGFLLASCRPLLASCWPLAGVLLACFWLLAGLLLASCWPLPGLLLASSFPTRISLENRFLGKLAKTVNSLHENNCFSMVSVFRGVPLIWGLFLASCWLLAGLFLASAGLLLASCWRLAGLLLVSCWPLAGLLLACCWLLAGLFLASAGLLLASCWRLAGFLLASCWPLAGLLLACCWLLAGLFLASCWLLAGFKLPHEDFSRKSVFGKARKNGEFSS